MKIGIMQPYFLPYIGYWQLMNAVDQYVVLEDVNYIKRGWVNRNRILVNGKPHYFNIQIQDASQNRLINETLLNRDRKYIEKTLHMIEFSYRKAPFFRKVFPLAEEILTYEEVWLVPFLIHSFSVITRYLEIRTEIILSSQIEKDISLKGEERIMDICRRLGADTYYNAIGGQELYSYENFQKKDIQLAFLQPGDIRYQQFGETFYHNLSILDVLMFNSRETIIQMLFDYKVLCKFG